MTSSAERTPESSGRKKKFMRHAAPGAMRRRRRSPRGSPEETVLKSYAAGPLITSALGTSVVVPDVAHQRGDRPRLLAQRRGGELHERRRENRSRHCPPGASTPRP
jgi:hypothetical protein